MMKNGNPSEIPDWLTDGPMDIIGRIAGSRNYVFLAAITAGEQERLAIYKPREGEYPLWDFPQGTLCLREVAAYRFSHALGWPHIPPTLLRDGPYGIGMVQQFIEADHEITYFTLREERLSDLLPVALFDHLTNNTDRKGGHLLLDSQDKIWAIDHALTFHAISKVRTVIWDFAGQEIPAPYLEDLRHLRERLEDERSLKEDLGQYLSPQEIQALEYRLEQLLTTGHLPTPDPERVSWPWPLI